MRSFCLTLTRNRQIGAVCWTIVLAAQLCAYFYPVRTLPLPLRVAVTVFLIAVGVAIVVTSLGLFTEKEDERAAENDRKANSTLFNLFFFLMAALMIWSKDSWSIILGRSDLLVVFAVVCLAKDLLFLGYERFGR